VLEDRRLNPQNAARLGIRDGSMDVYVPVHTMLLRFRNRAQVTQRDVEAAGIRALLHKPVEPDVLYGLLRSHLL